jgi:hypothetical protein
LESENPYTQESDSIATAFRMFAQPPKELREIRLLFELSEGIDPAALTWIGRIDRVLASFEHVGLHRTR